MQAFVLHHQLQVFSRGIALPDFVPISHSVDIPENSRAKAMGLDFAGPKQGVELKLGQFVVYATCLAVLVIDKLFEIFNAH